MIRFMLLLALLTIFSACGKENEAFNNCLNNAQVYGKQSLPRATEICCRHHGC